VKVKHSPERTAFPLGVKPRGTRPVQPVEAGSPEAWPRGGFTTRCGWRRTWSALWRTTARWKMTRGVTEDCT